MWRLRLVPWLVASAAVAGLTLLYWPALTTGFLNDDYLFIEDALRPGWTESLTRLSGPLGNYFRPVSRGLYFELLLPVLGLNPLGFHLFNFGLFLAALILLADLLRVFLPRAGVMVGLLYFATLPFHGVNLRWISCSQDLLALLFVLAAVALFRRGRIAWSALCYLGAVFSKESSLPLPLLLFFWPAVGPGPDDWRQRLRRVWPLGAVNLVWIAVTLWVRAGGNRGAPLTLGPSGVAAAYVHQLQSLLGLDHPAGMLESFMRHGPVPLALVALAPLALLLGRGAAQPVESPGAPATGSDPTRPPFWKFAGAWLLAFGFVTAPVAHTWSSYYYTLAAVGAALAVGQMARRIGPAGWLALCGILLWWNAAGTGIRAFAVLDHPWQWTSHLTSFYFQRAAALTDTLGRQLQSLVPAPEPRTRFFFAYLPSWAGFQMGNGAQVRILYKDPTLESYFLSQFSESTAAGPCQFLGWDGQSFATLYPSGSDMFFQIGSDLLVLGRPAGARHAFHRGLLAGEDPIDHYYWLGWTELWLGQRATAEEAWRRFGASDDSAKWFLRMRLARMALIDRGDSLEARRQLLAAIRSGIGHPEAHAVLGRLLLDRRPKYGLLELQVAVYLKPNDWLARRDLLLGLMQQELHGRAREELAALLPVYPGWEQDSLVVRARAALDRSARATSTVVRF